MDKWTQAVNTAVGQARALDLIKWSLVVGSWAAVFYALIAIDIWGGYLWAALWLATGLPLATKVVGLAASPVYFSVAVIQGPRRSNSLINDVKRLY